MHQTALLDVRAFPWRPRARVVDADSLRQSADPFTGADLDPGGILLGLALWLVVIIAAPLIALVLAALLFSVELPLVIVIALLLFVARFAGIIPWQVVVLDAVSGMERREAYRSIWRATRRIREVNNDRRVKVRWAWA